MLCPKCGADVGDSLQVCEKCAAEQGAAEDVQEAASGSEPEAEQCVQEQDVQRQRPAALIVAVIIILLVVAGSLVFIYLKKTGYGVPIYVSVGPSGTPTSASTQSDAALEQPTVAPEASVEVTTTTTGQIQTGDVVVTAAAAYARYNMFRNRIEIAFFRSVLPTAVQSTMVDAPNFAELGGNKAEVLFTLSLADEAKQCNTNFISGYDVKVFQNSKGMPIGGDFHFSDPKDGIVDIACDLVNGGPIKGRFKQAVLKKEIPLTWDFSFSTELVAKRGEASLAYDSSSARAALAILNRQNDVMEVGFFKNEVSSAEEEQLRVQKSILALSNKKPNVVLTMHLKKDTTVLAPVQLNKYGVTFYRDEAGGLDFPGKADKVTFYYIVNSGESPQIAKLSGYLNEKEQVRGHFQYSASKSMGEIPFRFNWNLRFDVPLIDIGAEVSTVSSKEQQVARSGPYGRAAVGKAQVEFKSWVALLYPEENDLAIGFYGEELSSQEKEEVKKKRFFWSYVNNKRPNLVLFFDFPAGQKEIKKDALSSYTLYFHRDKIGSFYFPGEFDSQAIKRVLVDIKPDEIEELKGNLSDNGTVSVKLKGYFSPKQSAEKFSCDVKATAPIMSVR